MHRLASFVARAPFVAFVLATMAAAGCSSTSEGNTPSTDTGTAADVVSFCATDPRALTFTPGLGQKGKAGAFEAKLLTIAPAPVSKGDNAWSLELLDATGKPVDGATLVIKPFMPDHGHGSAIVPLVTPTGSDGKYDITRLNLFMPGLWEITVNVTSGEVTDAVVFSFCVRE